METKVILVEDDESWRFLYRQRLRNATGVAIVAEFEMAEEAFEQIPRLCPDVALVDISLPGISGLEFAERMRKYPAVKIVLVTSHRKEYLSRHNPNEFLVIDKGDLKGLLESIKTAVES